MIDSHVSYFFSVKFEELQKNSSEAYRTVKTQKELITQLEGDLLNIRGLPSAVFRGEGVGAPSTNSPAPSTETELMSKAIQGLDIDGEGWRCNYFVVFFYSFYH